MRLTLREEILAGINFRNFLSDILQEVILMGFTNEFAGIIFRELGLTKNFTGFDFREHNKDFA